MSETEPTTETKRERPTVSGTDRPRVVVRLRPDEEHYDGDVLVIIANPTSKRDARLSVRPAPPEMKRCKCNGNGWGVVGEPDTMSRRVLRVPELCACIADAVAKSVGRDAKIASWSPPPGNKLLAEWQADLAAQITETGLLLEMLLKEREQQAYEAECEAIRLEEAAATGAPAVAEAARVLGAARDAVAAAKLEEELAEALLRDAKTVLAKARIVMAEAEGALAGAQRAAGPGAKGAEQFRATAATIRRAGPKSASGIRQLRLAGELKWLKREQQRASAIIVMAVTEPTASAAATEESAG